MKRKVKIQKSKFKSQKEAGLTLVEVLVATATAVIVGILLVNILINNNGLFYKQSSLINEGLSLNDALSEIDKNIRQAAQVASGYPQESPLYTTSATTVVLKLPALDNSGVISNVYDYIIISSSASEPKILRLQTFSDPQSIRQATNQVLTTILDSFSLEYLDNNGVAVAAIEASKVKATLKVLSKDTSIGSSRSSTIITSLRNKQL